MKILHYYWTQFDDDVRKGGGVKVYLNNIIPYQVKQGNIVYMLNSGVDYSVFNNKCFVKKIHETSNIKQFSLYNSPVMAPSKADFFCQHIYLNDKRIKSVFEQFIEENGPFDVIHFHSLEGLSLTVLELKKKFKNTKFIYSVHNYFPFCPQVNLWKHDKESCFDFCNGEDCVDCVGTLPSRQSINTYYVVVTLLKNIHSVKFLDFVINKARKYYKLLKKKKECAVNDEYISTLIDNKEKNEKSKGFYEFRKRNVEYINNYIDDVICVSKRVATICHNMGINPLMIRCVYIGTKFAENQCNTTKYDILQKSLKIGYMGYMRRDKGFYFFLECLKKMNDDLASNISVVVAAKNDDQNAVEELMALKGKFGSITYYDGYTHDTIGTILQGVNLGVVPVMWEDNLPQVAMEFKAMGIPVFASDRGGASELTEKTEFKFNAGDEDDFINKLKAIYLNRNLLKQYYEDSIVLSTIQNHCEEVQKIYCAN